MRPDVIAGLTAAAVVLPKALAYATIAGLPVQAGLYTALVPMVVYALLGTSRPLSVSTTTTIAILTGTALGLVVPDGDAGRMVAAAATLSVLVGLMLVVATALRLGFVANFISEPVLVGFKSGIGLVIVVDQLPKLFGIHIDKAGYLRYFISIGQHLPERSTATILLSVAIFDVIFVFERFVPRAPAPLFAVATAIAASMLLDLPNAGVEVIGVVPRGLPGLWLPQWTVIQQLWPAAAGIALLSFTETIACGRAFADQVSLAGREPRAACLGLATSGRPDRRDASGGGTSQTAVNRRAGAKSQMSELVTAAMTVATLLLLRR
jgi:MFS superfamily sulfate permease-like transporter